MAGLGWRKFNAGEVLTANNFQSYAVDQSVQNYAGTAARGSAIGTAVSEGMVSYLKDTNVVQVYDGAAWKDVYPANASDIAAGTLARARGGTNATTGAGIVPVIPTSVNVGSGSGSFNSTTGVVTFSGSSSVSVNGCFTSAYRNYRIQFNSWTATAYADGNLRLRASGTDLTTAYYRNGLLIDNTSASGFSSGNDSNFGNVLTITNGAAFSGSDIELKDPANTVQTKIAFYSHGWSGTIQRYITAAGFNTSTLAYDGFTIYLSSGNFTGDFKIYGWN